MTAFDADFLSMLERLASIAKRMGRARPPRRRPRRRVPSGAGEFRDRRPYAAGDDVRAIDWATYGRLGRLLTKLFEADEPRDVWVLFDASASMGAGVGGPRKLRWARRAAAAAAFLAAERHDRVGLVTFADAVLGRVPAAPGRGAPARLLAALDAVRPRGASDPARAFAALLETRRRRRRGLAVIVSDALWPGDPGRPLALLEAAGLEVALVHAIEPFDRAPPLEGNVALVDAETGAARPVAVDGPLLERLAAAFDAHAAALEAACARAGAAYVPARTDAPVEAALLELLRAAAAG